MAFLRSLCCVLALSCLGTALPAKAGSCPGAESLPLLSIDEIEEQSLPVTESWQVVWRDMPVSDTQLATLAEDTVVLEKIRDEMDGRGRWVFTGLGVAAAGTAASSVGWLLLGQDKVSRAITLPMAMGGILVGLAGILLMTDSIQRPLEPHLVPVPRHRMSREEARRMVVEANARLRQEICSAVGRDAS